MKHIAQVIQAAFLLLSTGLVFAQTSELEELPPLTSGSELVIDCTGSDCSISGEGSVSRGLLELAADLVSFAEGGSAGECTSESPSSANCTLPNGLTLACTGGSSSATCRVEGLQSTPLEDLLAIDCNASAGSGSCSFSSDNSAALDALDELDLTGNLRALAEGFLSCASFQSIGGGSSNSQCQEMVNRLAAGDAAPIIELLESLQALNPDNSIDSALSVLSMAQSNLLERIRQLRSGQSGSDQQAWLQNGEWHNAGTQFAQADAVANDATPQRNISEYGKLGFFINGSALSAEQDNAGTERGNETDSTVMTMGIDYRFSDSVVGGIAYSLANTSSEYQDNGGELDADSYLVMLYSSWYKNSWFVDSIVSLGGDSYEQTRNSLGHAYEADYHGSQTSVAVSGGYDWSMGSWNVASYGQLTVGKVEIDAFRETSETGSDIFEFDEQSRDVQTLNVGANLQYIFATEKGVFIPLFTVQAVNELEDEAQFVTGRFVGSGSSSAFELATNEIDTSYFVIGTGFNFQLKNGNAGFVKVESVEGYDNLDQTRFSAGWRWEL